MQRRDAGIVGRRVGRYGKTNVSSSPARTNKDNYPSRQQQRYRRRMILESWVSKRISQSRRERERQKLRRRGKWKSGGGAQLLLEIELNEPNEPWASTNSPEDGRDAAAQGRSVLGSRKGLSGGFCVGARRLCRGCITGLGAGPSSWFQGFSQNAILGPEITY